MSHDAADARRPVAGLSLPPRTAVASVLGYLALGAAGLPVFAGSASALLGPTGGYLLGFLPGVYLIARLAGGNEASLSRQLLAAAAAATLILCVGVVWRATWLGHGIGFSVASGLVPFVIKELCSAVGVRPGALCTRRLAEKPASRQ